MRVFFQVLYVDLQVCQKEFDLSFVLGLQKEAFVIPTISEAKCKSISVLQIKQQTKFLQVKFILFKRH